MNVRLLTDLLSYLEPILCLGALAAVWKRKQLRNFRFLSAFLALHVLLFVLMWPIVRWAGTGISRVLAYRVYFYTYWIGNAFYCVLLLCAVYELYKQSMAPSRSLQRRGLLLLRIAVAIAVIEPLWKLHSPHANATRFIMLAATQFQQLQSMITLCVALCVIVAIRPMGLSFRSDTFGVSLGLGILALSDLAATTASYHLGHMYLPYVLLNALPLIVAILIWTAFFALPRPNLADSRA